MSWVKVYLIRGSCYRGRSNITVQFLITIKKHIYLAISKHTLTLQGLLVNSTLAKRDSSENLADSALCEVYF